MKQFITYKDQPTLKISDIDAVIKSRDKVGEGGRYILFVFNNEAMNTTNLDWRFSSKKERDKVYDEVIRELDVIIIDPDQKRYTVTVGDDPYAAIREYEKTLGLQTIPIIGLTAAADTETKERCLSHGMSGYMTKPITKQQIKDVLIKYDLNKEENH